MNGIKTLFGKQKMIQTRGFETFSSYIADGPLEEVAFVVADVTKRRNCQHKIGRKGASRTGSSSPASSSCRYMQERARQVPR